jgi:hypothetical protein
MSHLNPNLPCYRQLTVAQTQAQGDEFSCGKISRKRGCIFFPGIQTRREPTCPEKRNPETFFSAWSWSFFFQRGSARSPSGRASRGAEALSALQDLLPAVRFFVHIHHLQVGSSFGSKQRVFFVFRGFQPAKGLSVSAPGHLWPQKVLFLFLFSYLFLF